MLLNLWLHDAVPIPFTLSGQQHNIYGGQPERYKDERAFYLATLELCPTLQNPPSVLSAYILESIARTVRDCIDAYAEELYEQSLQQAEPQQDSEQAHPDE